jgi:hypothetical protein
MIKSNAKGLKCDDETRDMGAANSSGEQQWAKKEGGESSAGGAK